MAKVTTLGDDALIALDTVRANVTNLFEPSLRLGVTGLSRAGKTVFITSLVHNLLHGGRLPLFDVASSGRLASARLTHQPDDDVPRFQIEDHVRALVEKRRWPESTRAISQLRLTLDYESASGWTRRFGAGRLSIDIVDYPGEWLLDLPLLGKSYGDWCREALVLAGEPRRAELAAKWRELADDTPPDSPFDEERARHLAEAYASYLREARADETAFSTLPPGRFLMPGDLEGSPALTFAPLPLARAEHPDGSFAAVMERRYEAYKRIVVKPFFRDHFARIDRQIVLVDALQALNAGSAALRDLEEALAGILECFNPGARSFLGSLFSVRTDRLAFAATKADHLHHSDHDRLETLLGSMVERASRRARFAGAQTEVLALAAVRATREGRVTSGSEKLDVIVGTPIEGETIDGRTFDGETETAIFPGDLPTSPAVLHDPDRSPDQLRFVRFRPPKVERTAEGLKLSLPHIRLDRTLQFLLGDRLA